MKDRPSNLEDRVRFRLENDRRYPLAAANALYLAINRDLRRAALLGWITPLLATRSRTLTASNVAACAAAGSPAAMATSAFLTNVRASVRNGLFRAARRSATRMRFFADFELANLLNPLRPDSKNHPASIRRALNRTNTSATLPVPEMISALPEGQV